MYIIVGLCNPGAKYEGTRHNVGWMAIDKLAAQYHIDIERKSFKGLIGRGLIGGQQVLLLKPLTFMNLSGESVRPAFDFYKVEPDHVLVISDDINLETGQLRIRKKGSAGGHNGLKNIILHLGTDQFPRVRIGVGGPGRKDLKDFVLGHFQSDEKDLIDDAADRAAMAIVKMIEEGPEAAMNLYNMKKEKTAKEKTPKDKLPNEKAPKVMVPDGEASKEQGHEEGTSKEQGHEEDASGEQAVQERGRGGES